jgi:hypothetical protein
MMKIELPGRVTIEAPATKVWQVIAHDFANIGRWAASIPTSTALVDLPVPENIPEHAPVDGRACSAALPGFSTVHEKFTYFDEGNMRFGYAAVAGLPRFIRYAENNWSVHTITPERSRIEIRGEIELHGRLGWFLRPLLTWQMERAGKFTLEELKYYLEEGQPHPRKVRAQGHR